MDKKACRAHILGVPYPSQGHVNPMLQFCKRLVFKGVKATFIVTNFIYNTMTPESDMVIIDTISDGFDDGGFAHAESVTDYLTQLEVTGSKTLEELITRYERKGNPVDCVVYDAFCPWVLEIAKKVGVKGAAFFTQACTVAYVYYYVHHGMLKLPVKTLLAVTLSGLPPLELHDMPSFIHVHGSYPAYFKIVLNQFLNVDKADFVLVNTFYNSERKGLHYHHSIWTTKSKLTPSMTSTSSISTLHLPSSPGWEPNHQALLYI